MRRSLSGFKSHTRYSAGVQKKQNFAGCGMDVIVVLEFRKGEQFIPVILLLINKDSKVLLQFLIDSLRLSVTLRVVSGGSRQFNCKESVKFPGKFRYELRSTIGNDFLREA